VPGVLGVSAALEGPIMIRSGFGRAGVRLVGVDPGDHARASGLPDEIIEGDYRAFVDRTLLPPRPFPGFGVLEDDAADEPGAAAESHVPENIAEETGPEGQVGADTGDEGGWEDPEQEIPRLRALGAIPPARPPAPVPPASDDAEEDDGGGWEDPEQEIPRLRALGVIPRARPPEGVPDEAADPSAAPEVAPEAAGIPDATDPADPAEPPVVPVLLGAELAAELGIGAGDPVQLITPEGRLTPAGLVPGVLAARVAGVYATGVYQDDRDYAYVPLADAQAFLRAPDAVTAIVVRLGDPDLRPDERAAIVAAAGDAFVVEDWRQIHRNLFSAMFLEKIAFAVGLLFVILVAAFGILATNMASVMERAAEIAILKAMGAQDRLIARVFGLSGMIVGVLGCSGGVAAGLALCLWFGERGVPVRSDAFTLQALPLRPEPGEVALVAAAALVLVGLASVLPARAAAALRPVDGLRRVD
ncbi:MAG TPA: FtsX-like permease family protein, partial [Nannocystis sp.]